MTLAPGGGGGDGGDAVAGGGSNAGGEGSGDNGRAAGRGGKAAARPRGCPREVQLTSSCSTAQLQARQGAASFELATCPSACGSDTRAKEAAFV
eukprot:Transcript_21002.p5 GENE.Transcript_21002~~Transcript_21002.p5  ORF type:complete len:94 (-),score=21.24 Transcript_21002:158-439(-)